MRLFNNTQTNDNLILELVRHLALPLNTALIESIKVSDDKVIFFGIDCVLLEHDFSSRGITTIGKIRWFNESSGEGMIRLNSGRSVYFYSCNVVGADSHYPELVRNVQFTEGETVRLEIPTDKYIFESCGACYIEKKEN